MRRPVGSAFYDHSITVPLARAFEMGLGRLVVDALIPYLDLELHYSFTTQQETIIMVKG